MIGRGPNAEIRILDEGVSREHCEVVREGEKVTLRDLRSTNGTFCRGASVESLELTDGDKILVGSGTVLKFTYHDKLDEDFQRQMLESVLRDDLTKAFNKKYFLDRVESEFAYAVRHNMPVALVSFDIDHFKQTNDTLRPPGRRPRVDRGGQRRPGHRAGGGRVRPGGGRGVLDRLPGGRPDAR